MKLTFVNHASVIFHYKGIQILTDPWFSGRAFDNSWCLIRETPISSIAFDQLNYIWLSHEHPDHFSIKTLEAIPAHHRAGINILYQYTTDKRVKTAVRKLGFDQVIEIKRGQALRLLDDLEIQCEHFSSGDSWISLKTPSCTVLNLNDCSVKTVEEASNIKALTGEVDVLLSQFSFASGIANKGETERLSALAESKLEKLALQARAFNCKTVIPFASFIWFCHEENAYLNQYVNTPAMAYNYLKSHTTANPVLLHYGESWEVGSSHDSAASLRNFHATYRSSEPEMLNNLSRSQKIGLDTIKEAAQAFIRSSEDRLEDMDDVSFYLTDYGTSFHLCRDQGLAESGNDKAFGDILFSSDALLLCLKYKEGFETVRIGGRFQRSPGRDFRKVSALFQNRSFV